MADPSNLDALFKQVAETQSRLANLGEGLPPDQAAQLQRFQQQLPTIKAQAEAALKKAKDIRTEHENAKQRLRRPNFESDKEGDLDTVPNLFEAEHGQKPEEVNGLVQLLRELAKQE